MGHPKPFRVLFVCMGNICRSPAGEGVLRHLADQAGLTHLLEIDSAGTIDLHTGNPPDARMQAAASARGIEISGAARQIDASDLEAFDLILTMDNENREDVDALKANAGGRAELRNFCELCTRHDHEEVPDPYYGGDEGFRLVLDLLEDGCAALLNQVRKR